ncbi:MAG: aerobic carbon-monoxide dehydrogenase large subunit, partial [Rubrivivax sp.]
MNAPTDPKLLERSAALQGMGDSRLRKEDARFIQGKGNYVDDIKMPGMLHMDIVRSPLAHARIKKIDKTEALKVPGVIAVLTAEDLKPLKLHWMPTLAGDVAAVLADGKVHFQMQEVAVVIAEDRYAAADGVEAVLVEYDELPVVIDPYEALQPDAPVIREDLAGKTSGAHGPREHHNHIFTWDAGDKSAADAAFAAAPVTVKEHIFYPRVHPCPLETCGCVASFDPVRGELTTYMTSQAPHVVRTVVSLLSGIPESKVRIVSPDIGGGFGNKVGVYPGYVCAIVASIVLGKPVKWVEDRVENISSTAFARDYHMDGEIAATADGKITGLRVNVVADHGAFDACADPTKFPAGLFHICSGSYDIPAAHASVKGVYTNKAPGGVAYRCSFRVTEAVYLIERMVDVLAQKLGMDKAEIRAKNFIRKEQFPYTSAFGFEYDSGDYQTALDKVLTAVDYKALRAEQAAKRADPISPTLMGIGLVTFTEVVGAGPSKMCDILGVGMFDSCEIRIHPTGSAIARMGTITQGQGHQTTYAQIIATELGIPSEVIQVEEGDTSTAPYGLGTYGSRSTPVAGAAIALAARKIHAKARKIAAHLLEVGENDLDWEIDRFNVKGDPSRHKTMKDIAWAAYNNVPA